MLVCRCAERTLLLKPQRTINGQKLDPRLPEPDAPLDYVPKTPAHHLGFNAEIQLANDIAAVPNMQVISYGGKIGTHGNDVVAVNKVTGDVFLYDSKYLSSYRNVPPSKTFMDSKRRANAVREARDNINESNLPAAARQKALDNLDNRNFVTITVAAGKTRTSRIVPFRNNAPY